MSSVLAATPIEEFARNAERDLGSDGVRRGHLDEFAVDAAIPAIAVTPHSPEQLARALADAHDARLAVIPVGTATHLSLGNCPASYDVALSTRALDRVVAYEPADMTVTVETGARIDDVQSVLAERGQYLPLDPASSGTIGGLLASNAYGPLRHAFGTVRDWLIGIRVAHADGSQSKSGGRVVKNVTGYDVHKLYVGSLGTLAVITEATFKLAPLPRADTTLAIECHSAREGCVLVESAHNAGLAIHAAELLSPPTAYALLGQSRWSLLLRIAGSAAAVERTIRDVSSSAAETGANIEERSSTPTWMAWRIAFAGGSLALRFGALPSQVAEMMQLLDRQFIGASAHLSATVTAGVIRVQLHPSREARAGALVAAASEIARRYAASVVVEAAPMSLKRQIDVFGPLRSDFSVMRRLKDEFDERRILSPGRYAGRL